MVVFTREHVQRYSFPWCVFPARIEDCKIREQEAIRSRGSSLKTSTLTFSRDRVLSVHSSLGGETLSTHDLSRLTSVFVDLH